MYSVTTGIKLKFSLGALSQYVGGHLSERFLVIQGVPKNRRKGRAMPSNDGTDRNHLATEAILLERGSMGSGEALDLGDESSICIGRGPLNDMVLDYPWVSWRHVGIYWDQDSYWISDLGSRNGTFVNGQQLGERPSPPAESRPNRTWRPQQPGQLGLRRLA